MKNKIYWLAIKKGEITRVSKYASSLFGLNKNGFKIIQGYLPKNYVFVAKEQK
jgi:hypothetical protein